MTSNTDHVKTTLTKEQIDAHRQASVKACGERLAALLQEYNCDLVAMPQFTQDGRVVAVVQLVAK